MSWRDIVKNQKPDYLDFDGDGDREEPMVDALETVEQVESTKKAEPITVESSKKIIALIADQKEALSLIDEVARRLYGGETVELSKVERLAVINLRQSEEVRLALVSLIEVLEGV